VAGLVSGAVGATVMTLGEKIEQRFTGRPDSLVPARVLQRLTGAAERPADQSRAANWSSAGYVFGVWSGIAVASGLASLIGYLALDGVSPALIAVITAVAAGAILAMLADTMIPEAFERAHALTGLITAVGFLTALAVHLAGE